MSTQAKSILISAGELSGCQHATQLVNTVKLALPQVKFSGMGAAPMDQAGVELLVNTQQLSIIGGWEIITQFRHLIRAWRIMYRAIHHDRPDLLILVDYPGFNLLLARAAKRAGIKTLYFISPKVWAWRQKRVRLIRQIIDRMAVIFPFEVAFYQQHHVPVDFVGNPLVQQVHSSLTVTEARCKMGGAPNRRIVGLFPGSRRSEIKRLLPTMLASARLLAKRDPSLQFILVQATSINTQLLRPFLSATTLPIKIVPGDSYDAMRACDVILAASGTVTLEIALMGVPLVVGYRLAWWEYQLAKRWIKIPYVSLCNILAGRQIAPELLQNSFTPQRIVAELERLLYDEEARNTIQTNLTQLRRLLTETKITPIAEIVRDLLAIDPSQTENLEKSDLNQMGELSGKPPKPIG